MVRVADQHKLALVVELGQVLPAVACKNMLGLHGEVGPQGVAEGGRLHGGKAGLEVGDVPGEVIDAVLRVEGADVARGAVVEDEARGLYALLVVAAATTVVVLAGLELSVGGAPDHAVGLAADLEDVVRAELEVVRVGEGGVVVGEVVEGGVEAGVADAQVAGGQERELVVAVVGEQGLADDEDLAGLELREPLAGEPGEGTAAGPDQVVRPAGAVQLQAAVVAEHETAVFVAVEEALPGVLVIVAKKHEVCVHVVGALPGVLAIVTKMHGVSVHVAGALPDLGSVLTPEDHIIVVADGQLRDLFAARVCGDNNEVPCLLVADNKPALVIHRCDHIAVLGGNGLPGSQVLSGADLVAGCDRLELRSMLVYGPLSETS